MPNWCSNELIIGSKNKDLIKTIHSEIINEEGHLDFKLITGVPDTPAYRNEFTDSQDEIRDDPTYWYKWNPENWGTKWNACDSDVVDPHSTLLTINFNTAWSPPEPVIRALSEKYPKANIALHYKEEGMNFEGVLIMKNNAVILEETRQCLPNIEWEMEGMIDEEE